jgi:hypothetical protein
MNRVASCLASFAFVAFTLVGSLGVVTVETGCKSTCTDSESTACTNAYSGCISEASVTADTAKCQQCADDYCACFDKCGSTCDKSNVSGKCNSSPDTTGPTK